MSRDMFRTWYRDNLNIEIALLVSLLLHAFAFGTWQFRDQLARLPLFSTLTKLIHIVHLPEKTAAPRSPTVTLTIVQVDEPQTKAEKQAQRFMETDPSQVTGEKPKNAKYYSDKSTIAANPNNPTSKVGDTPYLDGKETRAMNTLNVPSPSGAAAQPIAPPSMPGAPGATTPRPPPGLQAPNAPQKQAASPPAPPPDVAAQGVKLVDEQQLALAPKPTPQTEVVKGPDVPTPAAPTPDAPAGDGAQAMATPTDPGVPGREIVSRKAHLTVAGVTRSGVAAFGVEENPFGAYDKKIIKAVQSRWYALIDRFGMYERAGAVTVHFQLLDDGQVRDLTISDNSAGEILSLFCEKAIIESGPFDPLPDNLRALVGKEPRDASFTFYY